MGVVGAYFWPILESFHPPLEAQDTVTRTCDVIIGDHVHFGDGLGIRHIHELISDPINHVICIYVRQVEIFFLMKDEKREKMNMRGRKSKEMEIEVGKTKKQK